jgi:cardiolipin synthase
MPPSESISSRGSALPPPVLVAGNELRIFLDSRALIDAMVQDIRSARRRVWVEIYIFLNDAVGSAVAEALEERARAGVEVRLLYDAIGCQTTPASFFRNLERAGVTLHAYHSVSEALWRFAPLRILNRRNHRKLVVIDDEVAYFGGMNLVDSSRWAADAEHRPASTGWRDVHIRLSGPKQAEVAESFDRSWRRAHRQKVPRKARPYRLALLAPGEESIQFFDSGPGRRYTRAGRVFGRLIAAAGRGITLSMAYFIPVGRVWHELLRARRRGVHIRVIVPGESDVKLAQWATCHLYRSLLRRRIADFERSAEMLHSKVMVVDNQWAVVGSCNLDARSLFINLEFLAVIHSRAFARAMTEICKYELERSQRVTVQTCASRRFWQRWMDRLAWSLRWWL